MTILSTRPSGQAVGLIASVATFGALALVNRANAKRAERRNSIGGAFLTVDGVKVHYLARGEGPPIVLIHGNGSMIQDWMISGLVDELAATNRVIAFDRPGFGFTERPRSRIWTPEAQAELLAKAFDQVGIESPVVVGHSFGTQVALALALNHPAAVSRLVLLSGYYYPTARADAVLSSGPAVPVVGDAMRYTVSPPLGKMMEPAAHRKIFEPAEVPAEWKEQFPSGMALRPSQIRAVAAEAALMVPAAAKLSKRYGELALPVTIVTGDGDKLVDPAQSRQLHEAVNGSEFIVVPGAGHMVHHTAADRTRQAILSSV